MYTCCLDEKDNLPLFVLLHVTAVQGMFVCYVSMLVHMY